MAPTPAEIRSMFVPLSTQGSQSQFFTHVSPTVHWTIKGHSPMSGTYTSRDDFATDTLTYLRDKVLTEPLCIDVVHVSGGGSSEWATVEMEAKGAECRNGLKYDMTYCWVVRFDDEGVIVEVRAYLDTKLLTDAIEQNR